MARFDPSERASGRDWSRRAAARRASTVAPAIPKLLSAVVLAVGVAACGDSEAAQTGTSTAAASTQPAARPDRKPLEVDLRVVSGPGGVFAFAEVFINGKGPFAFTVDTGASRSVLDADLVRRVGVEAVGEPVEITGITCRGQAGRVRVQGWRVGGVRLPRAEIQSIDMPEPPDGTAIDGLLGSDILSRFGSVTVDYKAERLLLRGGGSDT